jgi:16S rRNA (adenine1518-N6/adenine1519-N6)-dimethyltransferase
MEPIRGEYDHRPKKRLGQHFLRDRGVINKIIDRAGFLQSDHVLEIGAGLGALTIPLAGRVRKITAVEKDPQLTDMLEEKIFRSGITNVTLINEDILRLDMEGIRGRSDEKIKAIGNLPYNISSPFLEKLLTSRDIISRAVLMFQYEFARRLISGPGGREYGAITVMIQYNAAVSQLLEVAKEAFYPRPKVGSMVLMIDMERQHPVRARDEAQFKRVVKAAFSHRRKTVLNSLKGALPSYGDEAISEALKRSGIDPRRRAETIDIEEFICLASELNAMEHVKPD